VTGLDIISFDSKPPIVDIDKAYDIAFQIAGEPEAAIDEARRQLERHDTLYACTLKVSLAYSKGLNEVLMQDRWMPRVFMLGAAVGAYTYDQAGFCPLIDDQVAQQVVAETRNGTTTDPFTIAGLSDSGLGIVLDAVAPHADIVNSSDEFAVRDLLLRGAGMTRLFIQTALAA